MMYAYGKGSCVFLLSLLLVACGQRDGLAPVVELKWHAANSKQQRHVVVSGETLYAIAFRYDQDYRQLAVINHLSSPYTLRVGQVLRLQQSQSVQPARQAPRAKYRRQTPVPYVNNKKSGNSQWLWPADGKVVSRFIPQQGKKGIDIAGKKGAIIRAASGGVVAYAGSGLSGYGNLIIIKHNNQYLSAYGNNARNLVREGQVIKSGQAIAQMGVVNRKFWGVHFEIRKAGQPVNPLNYLQKG